MRKLLLLTDSVALPRQSPELCVYNDTWPLLLKNDGYEISQVSIGGGTSSDLVRQIYYHHLFQPDIVIVQVGVVDCVPRFMTKLELEIARKIPLLGKIFIKSMNNSLIRKIRNINYVKPKDFDKNLDTIISFFEDLDVHFIGIVPPHPSYEKILPGVSKRIHQYNDILRTKANFIEMDSFPLDGVMSDFHHLNKLGHKKVYEKIISAINV